MAEVVGGAGAHGPGQGGAKRRDFLYLTAGAFGAVGTALAVWPLINQMNPAADAVASGRPVEVDLSAVAVGQSVTLVWRSNPIFVRHRTAEEIAAAEAVDVDALPDPQTDAERVKPGRAEWLVVIGICTHLGCIPVGQKPRDNRGDYGGWYCPCHASHYDTAGRIRRGPAPENLWLPPYRFADADLLIIGETGDNA